MRASTAFAIVILVMGHLSSALAAGLDGMAELNDADMSKLRGGFEVPGGLQIAIGLDVGIASTLANALAPGSQNTTPVASAALTRVNGSTDLLGLVQSNSGGTSQIVQNSLDNVTIQQITKLNIDVLNYNQVHTQLSPFTQLMSLSQLGGSLSGLPH